MGEVDSSTLLSVPPGDPSQVSRGARPPLAGVVQGRGQRGPRPGPRPDSPGSSPVQSMENLYGQGGEGTPPGAEDCDPGESALGPGGGLGLRGGRGQGRG